MYKLCRTCERRIATIEFWSGENDHCNNMWSWFYNLDIPSKVSKVLQIFGQKSCGNTPMPKPRTLRCRLAVWSEAYFSSLMHPKHELGRRGYVVSSAPEYHQGSRAVGGKLPARKNDVKHSSGKKWVSDRIQKCCGQQILPSAAIANGWKLQQVCCKSKSRIDRTRLGRFQPGPV